MISKYEEGKKKKKEEYLGFNGRTATDKEGEND